MERGISTSGTGRREGDEGNEGHGGFASSGLEAAGTVYCQVSLEELRRQRAEEAIRLRRDQLKTELHELKRSRRGGRGGEGGEGGGGDGGEADGTLSDPAGSNRRGEAGQRLDLHDAPLAGWQAEPALEAVSRQAAPSLFSFPVAAEPDASGNPDPGAVRSSRLAGLMSTTAADEEDLADLCDAWAYKLQGTPRGTPRGLRGEEELVADSWLLEQDQKRQRVEATRALTSQQRQDRTLKALYQESQQLRSQVITDAVRRHVQDCDVADSGDRDLSDVYSTPRAAPSLLGGGQQIEEAGAAGRRHLLVEDFQQQQQQRQSSRSGWSATAGAPTEAADLSSPPPAARNSATATLVPVWERGADSEGAAATTRAALTKSRSGGDESKSSSSEEARLRLALELEDLERSLAAAAHSVVAEQREMRRNLATVVVGLGRSVKSPIDPALALAWCMWVAATLQGLLGKTVEGVRSARTEAVTLTLNMSDSNFTKSPSENLKVPFLSWRFQTDAKRRRERRRTQVEFFASHWQEVPLRAALTSCFQAWTRLTSESRVEQIAEEAKSLRNAGVEKAARMWALSSEQMQLGISFRGWWLLTSLASPQAAPVEDLREEEADEGSRGRDAVEHNNDKRLLVDQKSLATSRLAVASLAEGVELGHSVAMDSWRQHTVWLVFRVWATLPASSRVERSAKRLEQIGPARIYDILSLADGRREKEASAMLLLATFRSWSTWHEAQRKKPIGEAVDTAVAYAEGEYLKVMDSMREVFEDFSFVIVTKANKSSILAWTFASWALLARRTRASSTEQNGKQLRVAVSDRLLRMAFEQSDSRLLGICWQSWQRIRQEAQSIAKVDAVGERRAAAILFLQKLFDSDKALISWHAWRHAVLEARQRRKESRSNVMFGMGLLEVYRSSTYLPLLLLTVLKAWRHGTATGIREAVDTGEEARSELEMLREEAEHLKANTRQQAFARLADRGGSYDSALADMARGRYSDHMKELDGGLEDKRLAIERKVIELSPEGQRREGESEAAWRQRVEEQSALAASRLADQWERERNAPVLGAMKSKMREAEARIEALLGQEAQLLEGSAASPRSETKQQLHAASVLSKPPPPPPTKPPPAVAGVKRQGPIALSVAKLDSDLEASAPFLKPVSTTHVQGSARQADQSAAAGEVSAASYLAHLESLVALRSQHWKSGSAVRTQAQEALLEFGNLKDEIVVLLEQASRTNYSAPEESNEEQNLSDKRFQTEKVLRLSEEAEALGASLQELATASKSRSEGLRSATEEASELLLQVPSAKRGGGLASFQNVTEVRQAARLLASELGEVGTAAERLEEASRLLAPRLHDEMRTLRALQEAVAAALPLSERDSGDSATLRGSLDAAGQLLDSAALVVDGLHFQSEQMLEYLKTTEFLRSQAGLAQDEVAATLQAEVAVKNPAVALLPVPSEGLAGQGDRPLTPRRRPPPSASSPRSFASPLLGPAATAVPRFGRDDEAKAEGQLVNDTLNKAHPSTVAAMERLLVAEGLDP